MSWRRVVPGLVLAVVFLPCDLSAQWPPDSLVNLQALPKDTPIRELREMMRGFADALAVRCIFCHVGEDENNLSTTDFVSDERIQKRKAREMIRIVREINGRLLANVPYEDMRQKYYGSASYDFRPFMLANVAEQISHESPDAAFRLLLLHRPALRRPRRHGPGRSGRSSGVSSTCRTTSSSAGCSAGYAEEATYRRQVRFRSSQRRATALTRSRRRIRSPCLKDGNDDPGWRPSTQGSVT
jgi:hypothetical protein